MICFWEFLHIKLFFNRSNLNQKCVFVSLCCRMEQCWFELIRRHPTMRPWISADLAILIIFGKTWVTPLSYEVVNNSNLELLKIILFYFSLFFIFHFSLFNFVFQSLLFYVKNSGMFLRYGKISESWVFDFWSRTFLWIFLISYRFFTLF